MRQEMIHTDPVQQSIYDHAFDAAYSAAEIAAYRVAFEKLSDAAAASAIAVVAASQAAGEAMRRARLSFDDNGKAVSITLSLSEAIATAHAVVGAVVNLDRDIEEREEIGRVGGLQELREVAARLDRLSSALLIAAQQEAK